MTTKKIIHIIGLFCGGAMAGVGVYMIHPGLSLVLVGIGIMMLCEEYGVEG